MNKRIAAVKTAVSAVALVGMVLFTGCDLINIDDPDNPVNPKTGGGGGGTPAGTQAKPIVFTGDRNGTYSINTGMQAGWFSFTANGRHTLTVRDRYYNSATTSPYTLDVKVSVLDADLEFMNDINNRRMSALDIGGNNNADITFTDLSGVYFVKIEPYSSGGTGTFYIGIANSGPITAGSGQTDAIDITAYNPIPYELEITSSRPARWFKFTADGRYTLTVRDRYYSSATASYTVDVKASVLDENLNYVKSINNTSISAVDIGGNNNADVILTDISGVYYVKIEAYSSTGTGSFYVAQTRTGPITAGSGQADAIPLTIGDPRVRDELTSSRPARWFKFTAPADGSVDLTVYDNQYQTSGLAEEKPNVDVKVTVLDAGLQFVSNSGRAMNGIDIGANNQSPVTINSLTPGNVYYVRIDPYSANRTGFFYIGVD